MTEHEAEVIIVGGGPVGLTLACDLSYRGVKTILLERSKTTSVIAKAFALNSRTMEHFRRLGLEKKIQEAAIPRDSPFNIGIYYPSILNGTTGFKLTFDSWGDTADGKRDKGFPFYEEGASPAIPMFCPQNCSEPVLKKHLETTSDCVDVLFGHQVESISQDDEGVLVRAVTEDGEKVFKGKYLVACDGGSSPSRKLLGNHLYGKFVVARAISIMFHSPQIYEEIKSKNQLGFLIVSNAEFFALMYTANKEGGIVMHIFQPATASDAKVKSYEQNPERAVKLATGSDHPFTILGSAAYNMHALVSTKFQVGRVVFAGDSAHQWLPAGGLGLNTGVGDIGDLGWKLEAMIKGFGGAHLLEMYDEERRPQVDSTRRYALAIGGNINVTGSRAVSFIQRVLLHTPGITSALGWLLTQFANVVLKESNLLTMGFQLSNSSIIVHEFDGEGKMVTPTHPSYQGYRYPALPGCRAPHMVLPDAESILDLFGKSFVLLVIGGGDGDLQALKEELERRQIPLQVFCYPKLPELKAYDRKYFLVRPDGVICWRGDTQPSNLESQKIAATVIGDVNRKQLPAPVPRIFTSRAPGSPTGSFVTDLWIRFGIACGLTHFLHLSYVASWLISFGFFWLTRAVRTSPPAEFIQETSRHTAVVLRTFGDADAVLTVDNGHTTSFGPHDVLIRAFAASVNPLDCRIRMGYGGTILAKLLPQTRKSVFPLVLGRDCSGEVVAIGDAVTNFCPGDHVFAAVPVHCQGTYAQLVAVNKDNVALKPANADYKEAASLPWVACSVWSALVKNAGLTPSNTRGKRVLVHAGTGGVGSFAVQLLKAWGADVTVTCSTQNINLAHNLGADKVVDYTAGDFSTALSGYDVVLDPIGFEYERRSLSVLKLFSGGKYVSLISPEFWLAHKLGQLMGGIIFSWIYRFKIGVNRLFFGRGFYYSKATPDGECLAAVCKMVEKGEIKPLIEAVYSMDEVIAAHKHVETGHSRGKSVITIS